MKICLSLILVLFFIIPIKNTYSQPYLVGKKDVTYYDPDRFYRAVNTKIFYPATSSGNNAPIVNGQFPLIVFGHGFLMPDENLYSYIWNALVPQGYIIAFPTTEGGVIPPPNHLEFAKDLKFLYNKLMSENTNSSSFFYNKLTTKAAVMGHSMGGKAATMASAHNTPFTAYISLAAAKEEGANNNNLLGNYAPYVTIPSLVISGLKDCAAPPQTNQIPLFDTITSQCKTFVGIIEGSHCNFASSSSICEQGETGDCGSISRTKQNSIVIELITPYLNYYLKNIPNAFNIFLNKLNTLDSITYTIKCDTLSTSYQHQNITIEEIEFKQDNVLNNLTIYSSLEIKNYSLYDISGRKIDIPLIKSNRNTLTFDLSHIKKGIYIIKLQTEHKTINKKLTIH